MPSPLPHRLQPTSNNPLIPGTEVLDIKVLTVPVYFHAAQSDTSIMPAFIPCLADVDIWGAISSLLVLGGVMLISWLIDYLKEKLFRPNPSKQHETAEERKIRKVIENARTRGKIPPGRTVASIPQASHHQPNNNRVQHSHPIPVTRQESTNRTVSSPSTVAAATSEEQAAASIQSLSNAEQEALASLQNKHATTPAAKHQTIHHASQPAATSATDLRHDLNNIQALRTAILYREILDKPVALRDTSR